METRHTAVAVDYRPPVVPSAVSVHDSYAHCKALSKRTAGNFYYSFLTLPSHQFREMCALYGFMRICDDLGDDPSRGIVDRTRKLQNWRRQLDRALDGDCSGHAIFPSLRDLVQRRRIPADYLHAVINGVEADLQPDGFETFNELSRYCYQVAGVVGLCCIHVWGFHDDRALARAVDCGTAFQLVNILRDLGEDAEMGRIYLPREELRRFDYSAADIAANRRDERFHELMRFQVERAKTYFERSEELFQFLEPPGRAIYAAMRHIYRGLLQEIERRDYDVYSERISLSRWQKLRFALGAIVKHRLCRR